VRSCDCQVRALRKARSCCPASNLSHSATGAGGLSGAWHRAGGTRPPGAQPGPDMDRTRH